jgi:hypothetical protein
MHLRIPAFLRSPAFWLMAGVFALEFFLFDQFGARRHTPVYPRWNDQIQYLTESYTGYEHARSRGLLAGLLEALINPSAQGTLHDFLAIIAFTIAGPSRSAALALNMLALIAWQAALFLAAVRTSGSRAFAAAAAMLPLALTGPWQNIPGSAYDFRLDHLAMCALGVTTAFALLSDGFLSRRDSTRFGIAVGVTLLTRFLTGTYFVLIFLGLAAWTLIGPDRKTRGLNLLRAALVAIVIAGPILWLNLEAVREYYWIGHYIGPESAIRNPHLGFGSSLRFVWEQLAVRHLGIFFGSIAVAGTIMLVSSRRTPRPLLSREAWWIGALFVLCPALVLTLHQQKSEVVISALAPGVVILIVAAWLAAARRASPAALSILGIGVTLSVLLFFTRHQIPPAYTPAALADIRQVNILADRVFIRARAAQLKELRLGVDYITDCLDAQVFRVICYERHRVLFPVNMTLPTGIAEPTDELVMSRLAESDFMFLTEDAPAGGFPYDRKLATMRPRLHTWCQTHMRVADRFTLFGRRMVLYQRREIPFP